MWKTQQVEDHGRGLRTSASNVLTTQWREKTKLNCKEGNATRRYMHIAASVIGDKQGCQMCVWTALRAVSLALD
jgi:hypothetical protein